VEKAIYRTLWIPDVRMGEYNGKFTTAQQARRIERVVFPGAQRVVVSAPRMKEYIIQQYGVPSSSVHVFQTTY